MTAVVDEPAAWAAGALVTLPLREAVYLRSIEHRHMPVVLADRMPGVDLVRYQVGVDHDEYFLTDPASGSGLRVVLTFEPRTGGVAVRIAELGPRCLWDELIIALSEWDRDGRALPRV